MGRVRIFMLLSLVLCWQVQAQAHTPDVVFVVHSYNQEYVWTQHINQGISEALRDLKPTIETCYLDAKRKPNPEDLRQRAAEVLQQIEAKHPKVIIAADDAAQLYLVKPYLKGRNTSQVIFCGVNAPVETYGFPAANVSGVRERWHFREGFALLKKIVPRAKRVAMITDDSESSTYVMEDLKNDKRRSGPFALRLAFVDQVHTFQQWQRKVQGYQSRADALAVGIFHSLLDEDTGKIATPEKVMAWTKKANRLPTLGFTDYAVDHGLLCGILESAHEQGFLAGSMARKVLEFGVRAGSLPVRINNTGTVMVNLKAAERLGVLVPYEIISSAGLVLQ